MNEATSGHWSPTMTPHPVSRSPRHSGFVPELESLRGLAAFSVLVEHSYSYGIAPSDNWFSNAGLFPIVHWLIHVLFNGRAAVLLFFVLSGYVLGIALDRDSAPIEQSVTSFVVRRLFRLLPVMWVAILFGYALALRFNMPANASPAMLFSNLRLATTELNSPLWTLHFELWCSLLFPAVYLVFGRLGSLGRLIMLMLLALLIFCPGLPAFLQVLVFFYCGLFAYRDGRHLMAYLHPTAARGLLALALLLYGVAPQLWAFHWSVMAYGDPRWYFLMEVPACSFIVCYVGHLRSGASGVVLRARWARWLGKVSFSIYAFHYPLVLVLWPQVRVYTVALQDYQLLQSSVLLLVVAPTTLLIAAVSHAWLETPTQRAGRAIGRWITSAARAPRENRTADKPK